jgi:hypothetical protein
MSKTLEDLSKTIPKPKSYRRSSRAGSEPDLLSPSSKSKEAKSSSESEPTSPTLSLTSKKPTRTRSKTLDHNEFRRFIFQHNVGVEIAKFTAEAEIERARIKAEAKAKEENAEAKNVESLTIITTEDLAKQDLVVEYVEFEDDDEKTEAISTSESSAATSTSEPATEITPAEIKKMTPGEEQKR